MDTINRTILCFAALAMVTACNTADVEPSAEDTPDTDFAPTVQVHDVSSPSLRTAQNSLDQFRLKPSERLLRPLGLSHPDEIGRAEPGLQLPVYALRTDGSAPDAEKALLDIKTRATLVVVDEEVRFMMYLAEHDGNWVMSRAGANEYAHMIATSVSRLEGLGIDPSDAILVEARAMAKSYLGYQKDGGWMLLAIDEEGEPQPLRDVLDALSQRSNPPPAVAPTRTP